MAAPPVSDAPVTGPSGLRPPQIHVAFTSFLALFAIVGVALYGLPFAPPEARVSEDAGVVITDVVRVEVEDAERCPHYGAAVLTGVSVGPSPLWVKLRLQALGVRSISNVVDATNLVMFEHGQPVHAFDLDRLQPSGSPGPCAAM